MGAGLFVLAFLFQIPIEASSNNPLSKNEIIAAQDTVLEQRQLPMGKMSRRAKAAQKRIAVRQIETVAVDTSRLILEAIRALPRDSSARIAQFKYVRKDEPSVDVEYHKNHPLFLSAPPVVKHQAVLDSSRWVYRLRQTINENDTRVPIEIPLEEYTSLRLKQIVRKNWESMAQFHQFQGDSKTTLGDIFGKITKIELPVPKNPLFSIFGPNIIRLNINGAIDIQAGFKNTKSDLSSSSLYGQDQSTPSFKQEIQVNVKGEIGDKLKIDADWNTQRTFEYENQLHVKYQGYDDEIVQSVEAGNVSLPTKSSFFSGGSALFGIMAKFQMGPLRLTTVATQKKAETKELAISGGGQSTEVEIRPANYSKSHFFIDTSYRKFYEDLYKAQPDVKPDNAAMQIEQIEVWVSTKTETDPSKYRNAIALMDLATVERMTANAGRQIVDSLRKSVIKPDPGQNEEAKFIKLDVDEFDYDKYSGIISLRSEPTDDQAVAVYFTINNNNAFRTIGQSSLTPKDTKDSLNLLLKLVRPSNLRPELKPAWQMMLKNRYSLGGTGIDKSSFAFNIEYQLSGQTAAQEVTEKNIGVLEMLGLDRYSGDNSATPDKVFDYMEGVTINEKRGEIIFPTIEPFGTTNLLRFFEKKAAANGPFVSTPAALADSFSYGSIYDKTLTGAVNDPKNLYYMRATVKTAVSSTYRLGGISVVEGSVVVTVDGQPAIPGADYTVDYISGQVIIKNAAYLTPGRSVQIKYESNDMFQLASKSLLGVRGEFDLGKNNSLGFTLMNYSEQSLSDKVRIGEEPISNTIIGLDGSTTFNARWLTNALNYIPGMKATALSQFSLRGEVAYMLPNPNTRTSPISSDGSKGVAYIDDFEGARQTIPLGASYAVWKDASAPWFIKDLDTFVPDTSDGRDFIPAIDDPNIMTASEKMNYKASACWFNIIPSDVTTETIWGKRKSVANGEGQVTSLDFYFRPAERGQFNYSMDLQNTIGLENTDPNSHRKSWAGVQHVLSTTSTNLIDQNVAFIELWINIVSQQDDSAKLNIDLGYISEDVIPNSDINTEDGLDNSLHIKRGIITEKYDYGIDTLDNSIEQQYYKSFYEHYPNHSEFGSDPSGDNWRQFPIGNGYSLSIGTAENYIGVNGTEGNFSSEEGHYPDTEDLNRNNKTDLINAYFEYEIPLDTTDARFKLLVTGEGDNNWRQIRIPLSDYKRKIGSATLTSVEGVRLWVSGAGRPMLFRIVELNLVGNQWEKRVKTDTSYEVSVVNFEDNPNYDAWKTGVTRQKDQSRPDDNVLGNEQSLNIIVKNLGDSQYKEAVRNMKERPIDMFNYRVLKMFVHGETGDLESDKGYHEFVYDTTYDAEMFLHFGDDTSNFYEYRAPVHPGWEGNDVIIKFADLTAVKTLPHDSTGLTSKVSVPGAAVGATYRVRGNPRLDRVQFISIGIENPKDKGKTSITGELWANELRLTDVDDTPGWAYKIDASVKLSDVGNIAFSYTERDPFFHGLEERFGSRSTTRSWSLSSSFAFERLLPESWGGSVLNVNYSHSESMTKPRYIPGTDMSVVDAAKLSSNPDSVKLTTETLNITDTYSAPTIRLNIPAKSWIILETINKMTFRYSYSITRQRSPSVEFAESWNWNATFEYNTQLNANNYLSLGSLKLFYTPKDLKFGATLYRSQSQSKARTKTAVTSMSHNLTAKRSMDFNWQFFEGGLFDFELAYSVNISSSLYHLNTDKQNNIRPFTSILGDIFFNKHIINFGTDVDLSQSTSFKTKLTVPKLLKMDKIFTPNFQYSVGYNWINNTLAGPIGRSAGWSGGPRFSLEVNLKPISESIWSSSMAPAPADTGAKKGSINVLKQLDGISRILFKYPFFDFEKFSINFTQTNSSRNSGVRGNTGFANFFARVPFFQSSLVENGPSLLYQLGFASDPNGYVVLKTKGSFPFITGYTMPGVRASNATISDAYSQNNQLSLHTQRPLWEGASIQLDWRVGWTYNENRSMSTDNNGNIINSTISKTISGEVDRSYMTFPPVFIFKIFNSSIEKVNEKYQAFAQDENDSRTPAAKLSQAFEEGLEALPWLSKILGSLAPRANWSIQWDGLEKFSLFKNFASRVSFNHVYTSNYRQRWQMTPTTSSVSGLTTMSEVITSQTVAYGFAPLIGVNITFKEFIKGSMNASFRYGASSNYNLSPSTQNMTQGSTSDISITGSYSRQGFEIPLFGISLMNNIEIAFSYNYSHNTSLFFDFKDFIKEGIPKDGYSRSTLEPRIRYSLSERVTASLYYRYTKTTPDEGGSTITGTTVNEGGLEVHVDIK